MLEGVTATTVDKLEHLDRQILEVDLAREPAPLGNHKTTPVAVFSANLLRHLLLPLVALKQRSLALALVVVVSLVRASPLVGVYLAAQHQALQLAEVYLVQRIILAVDLAQGQPIRTQGSALEGAFSGNRTTPSNSNQSPYSVVPHLLPVGDLAPPVLDLGAATRVQTLVEAYSATIPVIHLVNHNRSRIKLHLVEVLARHRIKTLRPRHSVGLDSLSSRSKSLVGYFQLHRPPALEVVSSVI